MKKGDGRNNRDKETDSEEDERMEVEENDILGRGRRRRRSTKVTTKVGQVKKRVVKKGVVKCINRYEALKGLEEED